MTTLTRHRGNSLFDTVFSDLFNDEFTTPDRDWETIL